MKEDVVEHLSKYFRKSFCCLKGYKEISKDNESEYIKYLEKELIDCKSFIIEQSYKIRKQKRIW